MRHFISNIVCGVIWSKRLRDKVRTRIRFPQTRDYVRYVRRFAKNMKHRKIRTLVGYGCKNFIVILNNKHVFKFPLLNDGKEISIREKRIVDAFYGISPIKIPLVKVIPYKNIYVRNVRIIGSTLRSRSADTKAYILDQLVRNVWSKIESGKIKPTIYRVLPITEAEEAHGILTRGENVGKVVLKVR